MTTFDRTSRIDLDDPPGSLKTSAAPTWVTPPANDYRRQDGERDHSQTAGQERHDRKLGGEPPK
jgi:hypothetical protein